MSSLRCARSNCGNRLDGAVVQRPRGSRRADLLAEAITQEGAQLTARLQCRDVPIDQPVATPCGPRHALRSMAATLEPGTTGASRSGRISTPMVPPQRSATRQSETKFR
jgi:hypothetical protein